MPRLAWEFAYEEKLTALHKHALQLSLASSIDEIAKCTLEAMESTLGFDHVDFLRVENGQLKVIGMRGLPVAFPAMPLDGPGIGVKAANTKSSIRVTDTRKDASYVDNRGFDWKGPPTMLSELAVPVVIDGATVAVLNVESPYLNSFRTEDQSLLEILAVQVGSELRRLMALEALRGHVVEQERLRTELKRYSEHLEELVEERSGKLAESEVRYRRLFESAPVSLWEEDFSEVKKHFDELRGRGVRDLRGYFTEHPEDLAKCASMVKIIDVNEATLRLYGAKTVDELRGELPRVLTHEFQDRLRDELVTLGEGKTRFESEFDNQSLTGDIKHVNLILSVVPGYEDTLAKVLVSIIDLTERKKMEDALRESERRFREMTDMLPETVLEQDLNGNYTFMNPAGLRAVGYDEGDLKRGLNAFQLVAPEDHDALREGMRRILNGAPSKGLELSIVRKDGSRFPEIAYASPIVKEGKAVGLRCVVVDITNRKRMEEELQAARKRLEYVVTSNPAAIYAGKPLPDCSAWYLTYLSERVNGIVGFEPREFVGDPEFWNSRVHPGDLRSFFAAVPRFFKEGRGTFDYRFLHKDGTYRWIREEARLVRDLDGKPLEVNGYWVDITEVKEMEQRLQQAERLATIGQLAAMVSHDLRNPLQGITGATYLLRNDSLTGEERNEMLQLIDDSVKHSDEIVAELLDYSREIHLALAEVTLKELTRSALQAVKVPDRIKVQEQSQEQPVVTVDPERMRRVFINLIANAVDAMPNGGTLTISTKESNGIVEITISDTGTGITSEVMKNLWKPLQTTKAKGMGLGLPIVKRIVDAHGGEVSVESKIGDGTTFTIHLPIKPKVVSQE